MIRVLHVFSLTNRGGAETMIMNYYRNIDRSKIQFDFVNHTTKECAYDKEILSMGGRIFHIPQYKGYNHFQYRKAWKMLFKAHSEYKIIHIHYFSLAGAIVDIAKTCGVKVRITHVHSVGTYASRFNLRFIMVQLLKPWMLKYSTHFFACGEKAGESYFGKMRKCKVIPNAINTMYFLPNQEFYYNFRQKLNIPNNALVLGHVGRFVGVKNHLFLLEIFEKLRRKYPNSYLVMVGSGELFSEIKEKITSLGLSDWVRLVGIQSNVHEWLQVFDVFVMPSILEGFPVSVVEAQAAGLPCVVSDVIDKTVNITGNVAFVPLAAGVDIWIEAIVKSRKEDFENSFNKIKESEYDIKRATRQMIDFYEDAYNV